MLEVTGDASRGGEWAFVRLVVDGDRIVEADAEGLERPLAGLTLLEAAAVPGESLATDALANAIGPVFRAAPDPARVAVAMSGGVDSAVALLRGGPAAIGVTLRLWIDPRAPDAQRACCSPEAVIAARETCHALGIPHVTLDAREAFRRAIVAPFIDAYARGETPNPCTRCNGSFRFGQLLAFARRAGATRLATGHYARIVEHRGRLLLARAVDERKDQSYMLARLDPGRLEEIWFPLGEQTKEDTRAEAERAGLRAAHRPESQEACFLGGGDYRDFLERHGLVSREGQVIDEQGRTLGSHRGFWRFTPGQRRGLGVAAGRPAYAVRTDPRANTVIAGPLEALARRTVTASGRLFAPVTQGEAKLRYRAPALPARVEPTSGGFRLRLDEPAYGVASGQTAVVYERDVVVGSGIIASSEP
ncbi:MAG TPA: tRNA 2-thiouridine(34) synthase MnmA [Gaiellaceae bacterium]|jgi:tRNA-specific 2-thiouridylase|nr:tRNA 2-thiouridine(34) synthase MnmA [Gaiellaceae bacterium]